jgi:uncharacterized protein YktA (UPF0223 family)
MHRLDHVHIASQEVMRLYTDALNRLRHVLARQRKEKQALSRFKQNSTYFMYRNVNGAWSNFKYDASSDSYICPEGKRLTYWKTQRISITSW